MKKILIVLSMLSGLGFARAAELGQKTEFARTPEGSPSFGLTFLREPESMIWLSFSFPTPGPVEPASFAFVEMDSGRMLTPWMDAFLKDSMVSEQAIQTSIDDPALVADIVKNLKNSAIVIALKQPSPNPTPSIYFDLRELCRAHPSVVTDADSGRHGCP